MKFFERFKKKREGETIDIGELSNWVIENSELGDNYKRVLGLFTEIEELKKEINEKLRVLGEVPVSVREGEKRLRVLVEGNRDNYIRVMGSFLANITLPRTIEGALNFCQGMEAELGEMSKKTSRNFYVMQNLIGNELVSITRDVKKMDELVKEVRNILEDEKLQRIEEINSKIKSYRESDLNNENVEELEAERKELMTKKEGLSYSIEDIKESDDYKVLVNLNMKLEKAKKDLIKSEGEIRNLFGHLERPLKKFERMYEGDILKFYLEDVVTGLVRDNQFLILGVLQSLKEKIGRLALKDSDKVLRVIAEIRKDKLLALRKEYIDLQIRIKDLEEQIRVNDVEDRIRKKENELSLIDIQISEVNKRIKGSSKVDKEELLRSLEDDVLNLTKIEVVIQDAMGG